MECIYHYEYYNLTTPPLSYSPSSSIPRPCFVSTSVVIILKSCTCTTKTRNVKNRPNAKNVAHRFANLFFFVPPRRERLRIDECTRNKQQEEEVTNATEEKRRANRFKRGILAFSRSLFFFIHRTTTTTTTFNRYRRTWFGMLELGELVRLGIRRIYGR